MILGAGYFVSGGSGSLFGGLVQVNTGRGGSSQIASTLTRTGTLAKQVTGSRTGEESRQIWVGGDQRVIVDYRVKLTRGRIRLHVTKVGLAGNTVWSTALEASGSDRVSVPVGAPGNYELVARTTAFEGSYEISYGVQ